MFRPFLQLIGLLGIAAALFVFVPGFFSAPPQKQHSETISPQRHLASASTPLPEESSSRIDLSREPDGNSQKTAQNKDRNESIASYENPPRATEALITLSRASLVNILCNASHNAILPLSGSGVIIDPRGVILTNAHVAQYVLLSSRPEVDLECVIRSGSPAQARWKADILYFPQAWMDRHAADITKNRPMGTGEYDYALLLITESVDEGPLPTAFPFMPPDTRIGITDVGDEVFLAAYPSEFAGRSATRDFLSAAVTTGAIRQLLTFREYTADLYSLGATIVAQSGSSGGSVVNRWGRLVGIISTTSGSDLIAERDLRALSLAYINRHLLNTTGRNLDEFLAQDVRAGTIRFMEQAVPSLSQRLIDQLAQ